MMKILAEYGDPIKVLAEYELEHENYLKELAQKDEEFAAKNKNNKDTTSVSMFSTVTRGDSNKNF